MVKSVHCIIHPFYQPGSEKLMPYYRNLATRVKNNRMSHLVFWAQAPHPMRPPLEVKDLSPSSTDAALALEHDLLKHVAAVFAGEPERVSFLVEGAETSFSSFDPSLMRMTHLPDFTQAAVQYGGETYYSSDFSTAYHKWMGNEPILWRYCPGSKAVEIDGKGYLMFTIPRELRKILRRLFFESATVELNGEMGLLHKKSGDMNGLELIGHGTALAGCVLDNTPAIALTLGIPPQNIEISLEQEKIWPSHDLLNLPHILPADLRFPFKHNTGTIAQRLSAHWMLFPNVIRKPSGDLS